MAIIPSLVNRLNASRINNIEFFRRNPAEVQERVLRDLLNKAARTEWGRKYDYASIRSAREYQLRVPVQDYDNLIPFVERMREGEADLLWPGQIRWFAKSSGTTSAKSKFIPVSRESMEECHYRGARDTLILYMMNNPASRIFPGKGLVLGGSHSVDKYSNNSLYGDLSAILIENAPAWVELVRTPVKKIALLPDFEQKLNLIIRSAVNANVTNISGVPSWFLVLIKQILSTTEKERLIDVWPNLEVFFHGGISFKPYRTNFKKLIGSDRMKYMETYNASEGFFGLQDDPYCNDMLLMLDYGIFYEFIPAEMVNSDSPPSLTIGEVEKGRNYAMVISTSGGLWRYMIGDTIQFTGTEPHKFTISGRTRHFINAFGEEIIIDNADKAIETACSLTGAVVTDYTAGPVYIGTESKGSHEWLIEFEKDPDDLTRFIEVLDDALKSVNSDYEAKRYKDLNLVMPVVRPLPTGTFNRWMKKNNKLGGQNKVPRLSNTREYIEDIYKVIGMHSAK
jgi:hypothetical protein